MQAVLVSFSLLRPKGFGGPAASIARQARETYYENTLIWNDGEGRRLLPVGNLPTFLKAMTALQYEYFNVLIEPGEALPNWSLRVDPIPEPEDLARAFAFSSYADETSEVPSTLGLWIQYRVERAEHDAVLNLWNRLRAITENIRYHMITYNGGHEASFSDATLARFRETIERLGRMNIVGVEFAAEVFRLRRALNDHDAVALRSDLTRRRFISAVADEVLENIPGARALAFGKGGE
jgi:hypothetical protein